MSLRPFNFHDLPFAPGTAQMRVQDGGGRKWVVPVTPDGSGVTGHAGVPDFPAEETLINLFFEAIGREGVPAPGFEWYGRQVSIPAPPVSDYWVTPIPAAYPRPLSPSWYQLPELLKAAQPVIPTRTREQICSFYLRFAGLTVTMPDGINWPWFEPALACPSVCPDASYRRSVYDAKHAAGDTHCLIDFSQGGILYDEGGQPYQVPQPNFEADPVSFRNLVEEILAAGFVPTVNFNGDNGDAQVDGYPNALRQLPILNDVLSGLHDQVLYARFYDGVFYGSDPANIEHFGREFTRIIRQGGNAPGHLIIEHQPGRVPVGGGSADYNPGGRMTDYDGVFGEFNSPVGDPSISTDRNGPGRVWNDHEGRWDSAYEWAMGNVWQVCKRLGGSDNYRRPFDQPADNDSNRSESYLSAGSPRGPYFWGIMETGGGGPRQPGVYDWVRGNCTVADLKRIGDYFRALDAPLVCLP